MTDLTCWIGMNCDFNQFGELIVGTIVSVGRNSIGVLVGEKTVYINHERIVSLW